MDGQDYVKQLFDLNTSASKARATMKQAAKDGLVQQYHKTLRESPEALLAEPLMAARRHIGSLLAGKRQTQQDPNLHPDLKAMRVDALNKTIKQVAEGSHRWAMAKLGKKG